MTYILIFLLWTFVIYWMHRFAHAWAFMREFHSDHHAQVTQNTITGLNWKNAFLWFDSWKSTVDQWLTEVIPTIVLSLATGHYWLLIAYYIWAAFIQEAIEHNEKINLYPFITSGKWHLIHHENPTRNYSVFIPLWDLIFNTWQGLDNDGKPLATK